MNIIEKLLYYNFRVLVVCIGFVGALIDWIAELFKVVLMLVLFVGTCDLVSSLPQPWQGIVLQVIIIGAALQFALFLAVMLWKRDLLTNVLDGPSSR